MDGRAGAAGRGADRFQERGDGADKGCSRMRRLLFVAHKLPYPPDKGERVRAFHAIRMLRRWFRVTVAAPQRPGTPTDAPPAGEWADRVVRVPDGRLRALARAARSALRGQAASQGYFDSRRLRRRLEEEARSGPFDVVVAYCSSMVPAALAVPARAHVADLVDADSAKWAAYARSAGPLGRVVYAREARAVRRLEQRAIENCDAVVAVSRAELHVLGLAGHPKALAVGNGVDAAYFDPAAVAARQTRGLAIVFTGTMSYRPNVDAVCWFAREVLPAVRRGVPEARFVIVGRDPAPAVRRLAGAPGVEVTGAVPDVRPYLAGAALAVCPLRLARGVQNKVLEAMAMGRAVVASAAALEGLDAEPGRNVLRSDGAEAWRQTVTALLGDPDRRGAIGRAAREHIVSRCTWEARLGPLVELCRTLANGPESAGSGERPGQQRAARPPAPTPSVEDAAR